MEELGLEPATVYLSSSKHLRIVEQVVPDSTIVLAGANLRVLGAQLPKFAAHQGALLWLVNGNASPAIMNAALQMGLVGVLATRGRRSTRVGWSMKQFVVRHERVVGGVTLHMSRFAFSTPAGQMHIIGPLEAVVAPNASTVLTVDPNATTRH
jgi:hypothetical protein